ncbi:MAG: ABC transporter ATP-binding protein [Leptolyngbyaceae bacterium]|nr:ABC transporter ATP-binding protein [Leptolyngbyaceae bacterium]
MTVSQFQKNHLQKHYKSSNSVVAYPCHALGNQQVEERAIAVRDLDMVFRNGEHVYPVLKSINLEIPLGDVYLLMGPSGSGKTTLLSIIAGILTPTSGHVRLLGTDIHQLNRTQLASFRRKHIGFIFQGFNLFPALTASENVEVALSMKGYSSSEAKHESHRLLKQVDLGNKGKTYPGDLSGGQKQRVAIARALAGNPPLIMADEPTAALDSSSGHAVISLLRSLAKEEGATVLMVTHDPRIKDIADHVIYLEDGEVQS